MTESFKKLKAYCERENYKGWDPFDGLNSQLFQSLPFVNKSRFLRLAWIQLFKRSPVNFRKAAFVKKGHNAKGLALFLIGYCNLYEIELGQGHLEKIKYLSRLLVDNRIEGYAGNCWGYNFDWQARAFYQPMGTPTIVATSFVTEALVRSYRITKNQELVKVISSVENFIFEDLNRTYAEDGNFTLSYSPRDKTQVFNAGLLGAKTLCLLYEFTENKEALAFSKRIINYVCQFQNTDGSWPYGTLPYHQWIDSFHTGYNLECIHTYQRVTGDLAFDSNLNEGLRYYLNHFFTREGVAKYYSNKIYPIDVHAPAQFLVTLSKMNRFKENKDLAERVLTWTIDHMQSPEGYFYYQKKRFYKNKLSYMRWTQAWMFYAFSFYFRAEISGDSRDLSS